jgi:hypothetical protein
MQTAGPPNAAGTETFPLGFPAARWLSFNAEEREQFRQAQTILDTLSGSSTLSVSGLVRATGLAYEDLGAALRLLEELALVSVEDNETDITVELVATPEDHIDVKFPDGCVRWLLVARPVVEPQLDATELN